MDGGCSHFAGSRRRPGEDLKFDVFANRGVDVAASGFVEPAGVAEFPWFEVRVLETPLGHLIGSPFCREFVVGSSSDAWAIAVREHVQGVHDLRMLEFFAAHFGVGSFIYPFLRDEGEEQGKSE